MRNIYYLSPFTLLFIILLSLSRFFTGPMVLAATSSSLDGVSDRCLEQLSRPQATQTNQCSEYIWTMLRVAEGDPIFAAFLNPSQALATGTISSKIRRQVNQLHDRYMDAVIRYATERLLGGASELELSQIRQMVRFYVEKGGNSGLGLIKKMCDGSGSTAVSTRPGIKFIQQNFCLDTITESLALYIDTGDNLPPQSRSLSYTAAIWKNLFVWTHQIGLSNAQRTIEPHEDSDLAQPIRNSAVKGRFKNWKRKIVPTVELTGAPVQLPSTNNGSIGKLLRQQFTPFNKRNRWEDGDPRLPSFSLPYLENVTDYESPVLLDENFNQAFRLKIRTVDPDPQTLQPILLNAVWQPAAAKEGSAARAMAEHRKRSGEPVLRGSTVIIFPGNCYIAESIDYLRAYYIDRGINTLAITLRGYQGSSGDVIEAGEPGMQLDGADAVRFAIEKLGIPRKKLFLHGHSLGGSIVAPTARDLALVSIADRTFNAPLVVAKDQIALLPSSIVKTVISSFDGTLTKHSVAKGYPIGLEYKLPPGHLSGKTTLVTNGLNSIKSFQEGSKDTFFLFSETDSLSPGRGKDAFVRAKYQKTADESEAAWQERVSQFYGSVDPAHYLFVPVGDDPLDQTQVYYRNAKRISFQSAVKNPRGVFTRQLRQFPVTGGENHDGPFTRNSETVEKLDRFLDQRGLLPHFPKSALARPL